MEAVKHLDKIKDLRIVHQTGQADEKRVIISYEQKGINFEVKPFFKNMAGVYEPADLVVCRAGATTVAELTALGKPAIFIPYPHAADNHQELNARSLWNKGASEMILQKELSGHLLAKKISKLAEDRRRLARMAETAKLSGKPEAAAIIVDNCYRIING